MIYALKREYTIKYKPVMLDFNVIMCYYFVSFIMLHNEII